jgi:hypothetical protein
MVLMCFACDPPCPDCVLEDRLPIYQEYWLDVATETNKVYKPCPECIANSDPSDEYDPRFANDVLQSLRETRRAKIKLGEKTNSRGYYELILPEEVYEGIRKNLISYYPYIQVSPESFLMYGMEVICASRA